MPYKDPEKKKQWYKDNKEILLAKRHKYMERCPWYRVWSNVKSRCLNKKHHYFKRGVKNFLKVADVKYLWIRDNAHNLKQPSIDRLDGKGHYTVNNCRIIELSKNLRRPKTKGGCYAIS